MDPGISKKSIRSVKRSGIPRWYALSVLVLTGLCFQASDAQPITFSTIRLPGGDAENSVTSLIQDRQGFLWIGTQGGLFKYDGYEFVNFGYDPDDPDSLPTSYIECLAVDRDGTMWVGTFGKGLYHFDPDSESFTAYRHDPDDPGSISQDTVTVLQFERDGTLWVGTHGGLNRFNREKGTFTRFVHDPRNPRSLSHDRVRSMLLDREGTLWVGTGSPFESRPEHGGLNRFDRRTGAFSVFKHDPGRSDGLVNNHVQALAEDRKGNIWIGTWGDGLHTFDRTSGRIIRYPYDPAHPERLSRPYRETINPMQGVTFIQEDRNGYLWIGALLGGINRYDPATRTVQHFQNVSGDSSLFVNDLLWKMYETFDGTLWIGSWAGLVKISTQKRNITFNQYRGTTPIVGIGAVSETRDGSLWMSTSSEGLVRGARTGKGPVHRYGYDPTSPRGLAGNVITQFYEDHSGTFWVAAAGVLHRYDKRTDTFTRYPVSNADPSRLGANDIQALLEDRDGYFWIGIYRGGLVRYDPRTGQKITFQHDSGNPGTLSGNTVNSLYQDRYGDLWIGTNNGLSRHRPGARTFTRYMRTSRDSTSLSDDSITGIQEDRNGTLWVATYEGGLNRYDRKTNSFTRFTQQNSILPTNHITSMMADSQGNLWLNTDVGIVQFNESGKIVTTHSVYQEAHLNPFTGLPLFRSKRGEIFLGGVNGFYSFNPAQLRIESSPPRVQLTGLRLFDETGNRNSLPRPMWKRTRVRLGHDQKTFSIDYVGLHYANAPQNRYQYKLEGYDKTWRHAGYQRTASYYDVPPGKYTFRVRAANADGVWDETGASIQIWIAPPWWHTWWAYTLYGMFLLSAVFSMDRLQRRRVVRKERAGALIREKELRAEAAEAWANFLQAENLRQTQELEQARTLQLSLLPPRIPDHPAVEIAAYMKTATEVGGDYYDFDVAEDGTLTLAIGDATGHGVPAGTMVTATKSLFSVFVRENDLERVLKESSKALRRMRMPRLYMTLALGKVRGRTLELIGTGLPPALIYRAETGRVETITLKGMPLGGPGSACYRSHVLTLSPGDIVLLMTDGFPETRNDQNELIGYEQAACRLPSLADRDPQGIIDFYVNEAACWAGEQPIADDMTFVVLKARG